MENIRVVIRVRPILSVDRATKDFPCLRVVSGGKKVELKVEPLKHELYKCNRCFPADTTQDAFYDQCGVERLLANALKGSPVSVFAFGAKGSGKTYTLFGNQTSTGANERSAGIIARSLWFLSDSRTESGDRYRIRISSVAIVDEQPYDLLADQQGGRFDLEVVESDTGEFILDEVTKVECSSHSSIARVLNAIHQAWNREHARRGHGHCLTQIYIETDVFDEKNNTSHAVALGTVSFIDVMCSDSLRPEKLAREEGCDKSLYVLSKVIDGIEHENNNDTAPTDSVLTSLVASSVGIRSRCLLISCIHEGRFHMDETLKTVRFSCVYVPKLPKYLDPQAKLIYDLKQELHYVNRQNKQLRETMITAPVWELHALSHTSEASQVTEANEEKALIEMHNSILRANETYKFHPRGGGKIYLPSKVAGRPIPIKPAMSPEQTLRVLKTTGSLDGSSQFSALVGDSFEASQTEATTASRTTAVHKEVSTETLEDLLRRRGTPGPMIFKVPPKSPVASEVESIPPAERVPTLRPLRETTQLGFNRAAVSVPLEDWPVEIRRRVAKAVEQEHPAVTRNASRPQTATVAAAGEESKFSWKHEDPLASPFVAHLLPHQPKPTDRQPFEIRLNTLDSALNPARPVTAPRKKEPDERRSRPSTSTSQLRAKELLALAKPKISSASSKRATSASQKTHRSEASDTANEVLTSRQGTGTAGHATPLDGTATPQEVVVEEPPVVGFNPRKPSVFAASLHSDQYNLGRRQSTLDTLETVNRLLGRSLSNLEPLTEESPSVSNKNDSTADRPPLVASMSQRQRSERFGLARAASGVSTSSSEGPGKLPPKANSFSSLPSEPGSPFLNRQKSKRLVV